MWRAKLRVEVDLGPARVLAERAQHPLQVADAHVVGDEREVLAPERVAGELEVARGARERLGAVEALVDPGALRAQPRAPPLAAARPLAVDAARLAGRCGSVSTRMSSRSVAVPARICVSPTAPSIPFGRDRVVAAGALEEHEALERVGVHVRLARRGLDLRAPARRRARRSPPPRRARACRAGGWCPWRRGGRTRPRAPGSQAKGSGRPCSSSPPGGGATVGTPPGVRSPSPAIPRIPTAASRRRRAPWRCGAVPGVGLSGARAAPL